MPGTITDSASRRNARKIIGCVPIEGRNFRNLSPKNELRIFMVCCSPLMQLARFDAGKEMAVEIP
jgi:hypothetical protein